MIEIYREVKGYEDYLISNYGKVFSLHANRLMAPALDAGGYCFVKIGGRQGKHMSIHRLVASAFLKNPDKKRTVNHKDGDKQNNAVFNLEWATHSENERHAWTNEMKKTSLLRLQKVSRAVKQLTMDGEVINEFYSARHASKCVGVDGSSIIKCCKGKMAHTKGFKWKYA